MNTSEQSCQNNCQAGVSPVATDSPHVQEQFIRHHGALLRARQFKHLLERITPEAGGREDLVVDVKLSRKSADGLSVITDPLCFTNEEYQYVVEAVVDAIDRLLVREVDEVTATLSAMLGTEVTRVVGD